MVRKERSANVVDLGVFSAPHLKDRRVRLYVPARPRKDRALLVMLDGQNVFGDEGSFAGGWHAHDTAASLRGAPAIVAVDHGGDERIAELGAPRSPKLDAFIDLIVDKVLPAVHAQTKLGYGPASHYVVGSSMGGLAALYMHFRRPEVFGGAVCMSPSLWYDRRAIFDFVAGQPNPSPSRIYLDAGTKEAGGRLPIVVQAMGARLEARGLPVKVLIDPRGAHNEASWRRRLPGALRFIFGR